MNIAICDNEPIICQQIKTELLSCPTNINCQISEYYSGRALLAAEMNFDLLFLDIELHDTVDGLKIAQLMLEKNPNLILIFISAYSKYVSSAFYFKTFQFLLKPIEQALLRQEFMRALKKYQSLHDEYQFTQNYEKITLAIKEIMYLESNKRKILLHSLEQKIYEFYGKLNDQKALSETHGFVRIHRSFLVNPEYISRFEQQSLVLTNHTTLPVSRKYAQSAKEKFISYLMR